MFLRLKHLKPPVICRGKVNTIQTTIIVLASIYQNICCCYKDTGHNQIKYTATHSSTGLILHTQWRGTCSIIARCSTRAHLTVAGYHSESYRRLHDVRIAIVLLFVDGHQRKSATVQCVVNSSSPCIELPTYWEWEWWYHGYVWSFSWRLAGYDHSFKLYFVYNLKKNIHYVV